MDSVDWEVRGGGVHHYQELEPEEGWAARCHQAFMRTALIPLLPAPAWPLCQGLQKECGVWWLTAICWYATSQSLNLSATTVPDFSTVTRVVKGAK